MIKNDKQLANSLRKLEGLTRTMEGLDSVEDRKAYETLIDELRADAAMYRQVRSGSIHAFNVSSLDEVGNAAISARIARGMTQRDLATELGVSEQMIQKDESREYENAGVAKVADVLDVLGYELVGCVRPKQPRVLPSRFVGDFLANFNDANIVATSASNTILVAASPSDSKASFYLDPLAVQGTDVTARSH